MIYIKLCLIANRHGRKILFRRKKQEDTKWNYVTMELNCPLCQGHFELV